MSDNSGMKIRFSKMHGAGNDFVVIDGVRQSIQLSPQQWQFLANRQFGIGADQILLVEKPTQADVDFNYRIFNANGGEVEHCGNGARCFVRFVNEQGLSSQSQLRVKTINGVLTLNRIDESRVQVDMGEPIFELAKLPFFANGLSHSREHAETLWTIPLAQNTSNVGSSELKQVHASVISMGNPHAVIMVDHAASFPVGIIGPAVQASQQFPAGVNVGFMQIIDRQHIALRVYERGSGETIACGTGACAAVVSGIRRGQLDRSVSVLTRGGVLEIQWLPGNHSNLANRVLMTGPTQTVFTGEIDIPEHLQNFHEQPLP
jgi:diaminopimelate epimerase